MPKKTAIGLAAIAVIAAGLASFFVAREVLQAETPYYPADQLVEEREKTRFEGELLGILLGPQQSMQERGIQVDWREICPSGMDVIPDETYIPKPSYLPSGAEQLKADPGFNLPTPSKTVCRDDKKVYGGRRDYAVPAFGEEARIEIARFTLSYRDIDASRERVQVEKLGGSSVIVVAPVPPEGGRGSNTIVIIPEESGYTEVQGFDLPVSEVLAVAESMVEVLGQ